MRHLKVFIALLALAIQGRAFSQSGQSLVVAADTIATACALTAARSGTIAIVKGQSNVADADGFAMYYDRTSVATPNGSTVFQPTNNVGRWIRITGMGGGGIYLNATSDIRCIDTTSLIATVDSSSITNVLTLGRTVKGDMGGGRFYFLSDANGANILHVNNGTVWRNGDNDGNWYYDLSQAKGGLNVLLWEGVSNRGGTNRCDTGLQAAIDFCQNPSYGSLAFQTNLFTGTYQSNRYATMPIFFPPGTYTIGSITNHGISMLGNGAGTLGFAFDDTNVVVRLQHANDATAPMIDFDRYGARLSGFQFFGAREKNTRGHQGVTGWGNRFDFTYAGSDPQSADFSEQPAFLYDSATSNYVGCVYLTNAAANAGTIYYTPFFGDEDLYASDMNIPNNDSLSIVFSPFVSLDDLSGIAPGLAGHPAILVHSMDPNLGTGNGMTIENCTINNFHAGIVLGRQKNTRINNVTIANISFAGICALFPLNCFNNCQIDNVIVDGSYTLNSDGDDPNVSYVNKFLRNGRYGLWNVNENVQIGKLTTIGVHTPVRIRQGPVSIGSVMGQNFSREIVHLFKTLGSSEAVDTNRHTASISSITAYMPTTGSETATEWSMRTNTCVVRVDGEFGVSVGDISIPYIPAPGYQNLPMMYRMSVGKMTIGSTAGAVAFYNMRDNTDPAVAVVPDRIQVMTRAQRDLILDPPNILIYQSDSTPGLRSFADGAWYRLNETADP